MRSKLIIIVLSIIFISCDRNSVEPIMLAKGTYTGSFSRSSPNAKYQASDVTLVFADNSFEGSSSIEKYPAICSGTFEINDEQIEFNNMCMWTAEFDWSYILDGEYDISKEGEVLIIQRNYGEGTYDTYTLRKN